MPLESYDEQIEREDIELRYANVLRALPRTLPHLQRSPCFLLLVKRLRNDEWKDWHILQAVFNGVVSWFLEQLGVSQGQRRDQENRIVRQLLKDGESLDDPLIPPAYFTYETMELLLNAGITTFLAKKGAVFRPRAYNFQKLRKLAQRRYQYMHLDVPHTPLFE